MYNGYFVKFDFIDNSHHNCNKFSWINMKLINLLKKLWIMMITILTNFSDNYEINLL